MKLEPFKKHLVDFLAYLEVERNLSEHTMRAYSADISLFIEFWTIICRKDKIAFGLQQAVERYLIALYHKKIEKSSIARKISSFQSYVRYLNHHGHDVILTIARPRVDRKLPQYLTVDELFHLLDTIKNNELPTKRPLRDKAILELLYATGIRCSELVNIKLQDINIEEKTIRIYGKGRKERLALFNTKAKSRILSYMNVERPPAHSPDEYLFLNFRNTALTSRSVQRIMEMFRTFLDIKRPITPHNIRHSFATHLLNQGTDLRIVQELLGHRSLSSTERYTHVTTAHLMEICDTLHPINSMKIPNSDE